MHRFIILLSSLLTLSGPALAATLPLAGGSDPRIQHLSYFEGDVYELPLAIGVVTTIVFDDEATLTSAQIGDSTSWTVERLSNRYMLSLKPLEHDGATNLTVTDSQGRIYTFDLKPRSPYSGGSAYRVHFSYPDRDAKRRLDEQKLERQRVEFDAMLEGRREANRNYTYSGSQSLRPTRMFDDGTKTYMAFPKNAVRPAVFLVNPDGTERIVEHRTVDGFVIVDLVGRQFTLRDGDEATCLFNKAWNQGSYDDLAPAEEPSQWGWFSMFAASDTGFEPVRDDR
jgi:type IV secretion system protein VirB9